jgi:hypothetical protein
MVIKTRAFTANDFIGYPLSVVERVQSSKSSKRKRVKIVQKVEIVERLK